MSPSIRTVRIRAASSTSPCIDLQVIRRPDDRRPPAVTGSAQQGLLNLGTTGRQAVAYPGQGGPVGRAVVRGPVEALFAQPVRIRPGNRNAPPKRRASCTRSCTASSSSPGAGSACHMTCSRSPSWRGTAWTWNMDMEPGLRTPAFPPGLSMSLWATPAADTPEVAMAVRWAASIERRHRRCSLASSRPSISDS